MWKLLNIENGTQELPLINLIYLGKRGGGVKLTEVIVNDLIRNAPASLGEIHLRKNIEWGSWNFDSRGIKIIEWGDVRSWKPRTFYLTRLLETLFRPNNLGFSESRINVVILTSPYSFPLELVLKLRGRSLVLIVHDVVRHFGDVWPSNFIIRFRNFLADGIVALSGSVGGQLRSNYPTKKIGIFPHPHFLYPIQKPPLEVTGLSGYILFIGRIRPYKGLDKLISANFIGSKLNARTIVIAGEGKLSSDLPENVVPIIKWLDDSEISSLIQKAEIIIFPYSEASQSGLIGTCISLNKKVLVSDVEGLVEQIEGYPNGYTARNLDPNPLSELIDTLCLAKVLPSQYPIANQISFIQALKNLKLNN